MPASLHLVEIQFAQVQFGGVVAGHPERARRDGGGRARDHDHGPHPFDGHRAHRRQQRLDREPARGGDLRRPGRVARQQPFGDPHRADVHAGRGGDGDPGASGSGRVGRADDQFRGTAADVHDQERACRRIEFGDGAAEGEFRLLAPVMISAGWPSTRCTRLSNSPRLAASRVAEVAAIRTAPTPDARRIAV